MNRVPKWYENLRTWREENSYTTEEWQAYIQAIVIRDGLIAAIFLVFGFGAGFVIANG